ncbi:MAG: radical SAM protein [Candidatus ainarchaeum sp.]|nr:radical SAM protein [Candidatus ainarchaeum sp.]
MNILPKVQIVYKKQFPKTFANDVAGWGFSKEELIANKGKVLSLDIDFGNYCSLNCPHCFRRNNKVDFGKHKLMGYKDIVALIEDAKKLGLKSVKFLGAGEPFENKRFLEFLRFLKKSKITPLIFTKGHVIGDDELVKKYYSDYGISTGRQLVKELKKLGAGILLGFNSFDTEIQDKMVGGVKGYSLKRNRALELLAEAGFNKPNPTRLALIATPLTKSNYKGAFDIYKWARQRNLYTIICPTMVSGRCAKEWAWHKITPSRKKLVDLYARIYKFNIEKGIQSLKQIKEEGISPYAGATPCHQIACGMYVTLTGTVLRCPGDDVTVFGSVWKEPLEQIWKKSENCKRAGTFNCGCPPKAGKSIPENFYSEVMKKLEKT